MKIIKGYTSWLNEATENTTEVKPGAAPVAKTVNVELAKSQNTLATGILGIVTIIAPENADKSPNLGNASLTVNIGGNASASYKQVGGIWKTSDQPAADSLIAIIENYAKSQPAMLGAKITLLKLVNDTLTIGKFQPLTETDSTKSMKGTLAYLTSSSPKVMTDSSKSYPMPVTAINAKSFNLVLAVVKDINTKSNVAVSTMLPSEIVLTDNATPVKFNIADDSKKFKTADELTRALVISIRKATTVGDGFEANILPAVKAAFDKTMAS